MLKKQLHVSRRVAVGALAVLASGSFMMSAAQAQNFPTKPITMIVSFPAGGSVDAAARIMQAGLAAELGQPIVIENRGGAGGTIATAAVAKAPADGYTLLLTLSSHTINPAIYRSLPFDTEKDFAPVSLVSSMAQVLVAHPDTGLKSLSQVLETAGKGARSKGLNYASAGTGTPAHIAGELLKQQTGANLTHIPYRGGGPAVADVLGNQVPMLWVSLPAVGDHIRAGRLTGIAVSTTRRSAAFPDVPAVAESIKDFEVDSWIALFAPAGTPPAVVSRVNEAVRKVLANEEVKQRFAAQGAETVGSSPQELGEVVSREIPQWRALAKAANIVVD